MATKKEKTVCTILGTITGGIIGYYSAKEEKDRWRYAFGSAFLGAAGGYGLACLLGEADDTVNYSCFHNQKRVYEGICYEDRKETRIIEHLANGKKITHVRFDQPKPRAEARVKEMARIKRFKPKYNVQHNQVAV